MAIGTDVKAPYYILGADGNYHKLLNENIVEQIEGVGRRPATAYEAGDVVASSTNSKVLLLCTQAGTTAETDLNIASKNAGDVVTDGTVTWEVIDRRITFNNLPNKPTTLAGYGITDAGLPVGHEFFTTNPNIPAGCIPLLGGEYSRTTYADLWAWVQTQNGYLVEESAWQAKATANGGNVPFYSKGNGSTTFRVPALKCWVRGAGSISEVGGYLAAGLPNIEGEWDNINQSSVHMANVHSNSILIGSFKKGKYYASGYTGRYNDVPAYNLGFDASLSNPIYGSSDTVQPPSIVGLWCVKAYGTITNVGSTDISNISTGLTQAETRISALENHGAGATVVESYRNGTEWYRVWSDGWVEQGGYVPKNSDTSSTVITINFLKPFANEDYVMYGGIQSTDSTTSTTYRGVGVRGENTTDVHSKTGFKMLKHPYASKFWYACGQGA